jgi:hypothetical protein
MTTPDSKIHSWLVNAARYVIGNTAKETKHFTPTENVEVTEEPIPEPPAIDVVIAPKGDGINYINIWNKGETELGCMLSHFYSASFVHPHYGYFSSMEGFWHYIRTAEKDDSLRNLTGIKAKNHGRTFTQEFVFNFCDIINEANFFKIEQNPKIKELFLKSDLPFEFYYLYGSGPVVIRPNGWEWLVAGFERTRTLMKAGERLPPVIYTP